MGLFTEAMEAVGRLVPARKAISHPRPTVGWGRAIMDRDLREIGDGSRSSILVPLLAWLMRTYPEAPVTVHHKTPDGPERVPEHPLLDILERPNPYYSGDQLWAAKCLSYTIDGNAYFLKDRAESDGPVAYWYAPHWLIEPISEGDDFITYYRYRPTPQTEIKVAPRDVIHFRFGLDPTDPRKGYSPIKPMLREIWTDEEAARFSATMLRNLGVPGIVVSPAPSAGNDYVPSQQELDATKAQLIARTTGDERGKPLIMSGPTNIAQFGFSPEQMDLSKLRGIPETRVAAAVGIPAAVVGFLTGLEMTKVGATMRELRELAVESVIIPTKKTDAADLESQALGDFVDDPTEWIVGHDWTQVRVLQEDENARSERVTIQLQRSVIKRNEARRELGYPEDPDGDVYLQPINVVEVRTGEPAPAPPPTTRARKAGAIDDVSDADRRLFRELSRARERVEGVWEPALREQFEGMGERAAAAFRRIPAGILAAPALAGRGNGAAQAKAASDEEIAARVVEGMGIQAAVDEVGNQYTRYYAMTGELTYGAVGARLGIELAFDLADPLARDVVLAGGKRMGLLDISGDAKAAIFRALRDARAEGEGADGMARRIRQYVPEGPYRHAGTEYRSRMIARTETKYAQNVSTLAAYTKSDVVRAVRAYDNQTGFGDDECTARDGREYPISEAGGLTASEHPNGTLSWGPVVGARAIQ